MERPQAALDTAVSGSLLRSSGLRESEAPSHDRSVADLAALAVALLDHLEIDGALVVGHSIGGAIAQTLALDHAARISSLMLSATRQKESDGALPAGSD